MTIAPLKLCDDNSLCGHRNRLGFCNVQAGDPKKSAFFDVASDRVSILTIEVNIKAVGVLKVVLRIVRHAPRYTFAVRDVARAVAACIWCVPIIHEDFAAPGLIIYVDPLRANAHIGELGIIEAPVDIFTGVYDGGQRVDTQTFFWIIAVVPEVGFRTSLFESTDRIRVINVGRYVVEAAGPVEREGVLIICHEPVNLAGVIDLTLAVRVWICGVAILLVDHAW